MNALDKKESLCNKTSCFAHTLRGYCAILDCAIPGDCPFYKTNRQFVDSFLKYNPEFIDGIKASNTIKYDKKKQATYIIAELNRRIKEDEPNN